MRHLGIYITHYLLLEIPLFLRRDYDFVTLIRGSSDFISTACRFVALPNALRNFITKKISRHFDKIATLPFSFHLTSRYNLAETHKMHLLI